MNSHVAEAARTEIPPATPFEGYIRRMIRAERRWPEPQIPVQRRRHGWRVTGPLNALRPIQRRLSPIGGSVGPNMHFAHRPDGAVGEPFVDEAVAFEGHPLITHLRRNLRLARRQRQRANLLPGTGVWLLNIDLPPQL